MPVSSVGIATARDSLTIHFSADDVWKTVNDFSKLPPEEARSVYKLRKDARDWKIPLAQQDLLESGPTFERVTPILYRPFDIRHTYFTGKSRGFHCMPRPAVMGHFFGRGNIGLVTSRLTKGEDFAHAQVTRHITEVICMSPKTSNNGFIFPLWLYQKAADADLLKGSERQPNFDAGFLEALGDAVEYTPTPEQAFAWIYAVLHSPSFRNRYREFLRRDFPRVPLPNSRNLFDTLVVFGEELIALHVMEKTLPRITTFDVTGGNTVDKVRWAPGKDGNGRVYINAEQYFGDVPEVVWETHIGGYRVADKWLKDRRERSLNYDDLEHYQSMIAALARTLEIQANIDDAIGDAGGWPLQ